MKCQITLKVFEELELLKEECAEVIHLASKSTRFGLFDENPDKRALNVKLLEQELGDIAFLVDRLCEADVGISHDGIFNAKIRKAVKFEKLKRDMKEKCR